MFSIIISIIALALSAAALIITFINKKQLEEAIANHSHPEIPDEPEPDTYRDNVYGETFYNK